MRKIIILIICSLLQNNLFSQEYIEDDFFYYDLFEGITIYGDQNILENKILDTLTKGQKERKAFIQEDLLSNSGFKKSADAKIRDVPIAEKTASLFLHGIFDFLTLGLVKTKPLTEPEYDNLPEGEFYNFYVVLIQSELKDVSLEIQKIMELEYKLQIEFCNGVLMERKNKKYYTEENIKSFEQLILSLPDDIDDIKQIKERFLNIELPKIKSALYRYLNPSESYLQARENFKRIKFN